MLLYTSCTCHAVVRIVYPGKDAAPGAADVLPNAALSMHLVASNMAVHCMHRATLLSNSTSTLICITCSSVPSQTTGGMLYSLECGDAARGCRVDVSDSKVALLTTSLTTPPISLESLSAFDLASGKILWHGVSGSNKLAVPPQGSCTAIAAPHKDLWFACTCNPSSPAPAPPGQPQGGSGSSSTSDSNNSGGGANDVERADLLELTLQRRRKRRDDDVGRTGLCAYAVASSSGKLLSEVRVAITFQVYICSTGLALPQRHFRKTSEDSL
jgi:hypothetical protein